MSHIGVLEVMWEFVPQLFVTLWSRLMHEITICSGCGTRVQPRRDGKCPSCQKVIAEVLPPLETKLPVTGSLEKNQQLPAGTPLPNDTESAAATRMQSINRRSDSSMTLPQHASGRSQGNTVPFPNSRPFSGTEMIWCGAVFSGLLCGFPAACLLLHDAAFEYGAFWSILWWTIASVLTCAVASLPVLFLRNRSVGEFLTLVALTPWIHLILLFAGFFLLITMGMVVSIRPDVAELPGRVLLENVAKWGGPIAGVALLWGTFRTRGRLLANAVLMLLATSIGTSLCAAIFVGLLRLDGARVSDALLVSSYRESGVGTAAEVADLRHSLWFQPDNSTSHNNLAWIRATHPSESMRSGAEALHHSTIACQLTDWKQPAMVGTAAAACAETGDFQKALEYQQLALSLLPAGSRNRQTFEEALELYQKAVPYRDAAQLPLAEL